MAMRADDRRKSSVCLELILCHGSSPLGSPQIALLVCLELILCHGSSPLGSPQIALLGGTCLRLKSVVPKSLLLARISTRKAHGRGSQPSYFSIRCLRLIDTPSVLARSYSSVSALACNEKTTLRASFNVSVCAKSNEASGTSRSPPSFKRQCSSVPSTQYSRASTAAPP